MSSSPILEMVADIAVVGLVVWGGMRCHFELWKARRAQ